MTTDPQDVRTPYLVQRCQVRTSSLQDQQHFSANFQCDYMGSAEFEFGALPASLRRLAAGQPQVVQVAAITNLAGQTLRLFSAFREAALDAYIAQLAKLRVGTVYTKESTYFDLATETQRRDQLAANARLPQPRQRYVRPPVDLWWDISNDAMFTFQAQVAKVLPGCLTASLRYMDEQAAKAAA